MSEISRMIGGITVKVCTLSNLRLQYSVEENSVFRMLDVRADRNMWILLLLLQLLSVRQININSSYLLLLSSIIMQEISSLNRSSSDSLVMICLAFIVLRLINFVDILNQWLIHSIWNMFRVFQMHATLALPHLRLMIVTKSWPWGSHCFINNLLLVCCVHESRINNEIW